MLKNQLNYKTYDLLDFTNHGMNSEKHKKHHGKVELISFGFVRQYLAHIRIDDIATIVFYFLFNPNAPFLHNKDFTKIKYVECFESIDQMEEKQKQDEKKDGDDIMNIPEWGGIFGTNLNFEIEWPPHVKDARAAGPYSTVVLAPFLSQTLMQHVNQLRQLRRLNHEKNWNWNKNNELQDNYNHDTTQQEKVHTLSFDFKFQKIQNNYDENINNFGEHYWQNKLLSFQCGILIFPKKILIQNIASRNISQDDLFVHRGNLHNLKFMFTDQRPSLNEIDWKLNQRLNIDSPHINGFRLYCINIGKKKSNNYGSRKLINTSNLRFGNNKSYDITKKIDFNNNRIELCIDYKYNDKEDNYRKGKGKEKEKKIYEISSLLDARNMKAWIYFQQNNQIIGNDIDNEKYKCRNGKIELDFVHNYHLLCVADVEGTIVQVTKFW